MESCSIETVRKESIEYIRVKTRTFVRTIRAVLLLANQKERSTPTRAPKSRLCVNELVDFG